MRKHKRKVLIFLSVIILLCTFFDPEVYINSRRLSNALASNDKDSLVLNDALPFNWDFLYSFDPYVSSERIEEVIGFKSRHIKTAVSEGMTQLIFVKGKKVVACVCGYPQMLGYSVSFHGTAGDYALLKSENRPVFYLEKTDGILNYFYDF